MYNYNVVHIQLYMHKQKVFSIVLESTIISNSIVTIFSNSTPLHLLGVFLVTCLCLHLLYLNGVWLTTTQVQLMVAHAQSEDTTVDTETRSKEHKVLESENKKK